MIRLLKILSFIGLGFSILPSMLVFAGKMELEWHYNLMAFGMLLWFATAVFWVKAESHEAPTQREDSQME